MDCQEIKKLLVPYLESDLSESDRVIVEAHLHTCADCQKEKDLLERSWAMLDGFSAPEVSSNFTWNLMSRIREQEEARPRFVFPEINIQFGFRVLVPALVSACVLIVAYVFIKNHPVQEPQIAKVVSPVVSPAVSPAAEKTEIEQAVVTYLTGTAQVLLSGQQEYAQAQTGMVLKAGDAVKTGPEGAMELSFDSDNNKIVRIQANTTAAVTFDGNEKMMLSEGELFATINALPEHSAFEIRTPTAVSGARGTAWTTRVDAEGTTVESIDRTPYIKSIEVDGRVSEQETKVEAGYYTVVPRVREPPRPVQAIPPEKRMRYASLHDDIRQHARQDLIEQRTRPKFDRESFIRKSADDKARKMAPRVDDNHVRVKEPEQGRSGPQDRPGAREGLGRPAGQHEGAIEGPGSPGVGPGPGRKPPQGQKQVSGPGGSPGSGKDQDKGNNPPGPREGPGTNVGNPPGPQGGPGAGPDKKPPKGKGQGQGGGQGNGSGSGKDKDNGNNRPGPRSGPGPGGRGPRK